MHSILALTDMKFVPPVVADIWRVVLWVAQVLLIGRYLAVLPSRYRTWRRASLYGAGALLAFMVSGVLIMAERFGHRVVWELAIPYTVATILAWLSLRELCEGPSRADRRFG